MATVISIDDLPRLGAHLVVGGRQTGKCTFAARLSRERDAMPLYLFGNRIAATNRFSELDFGSYPYEIFRQDWQKIDRLLQKQEQLLRESGFSSMPHRFHRRVIVFVADSDVHNALLLKLLGNHERLGLDVIVVLQDMSMISNDVLDHVQHLTSMSPLKESLKAAGINEAVGNGGLPAVHTFEMFTSRMLKISDADHKMQVEHDGHMLPLSSAL